MKLRHLLPICLFLAPLHLLHAQEEEELDSAALMNALQKMFKPENVEVKPSYTFQHKVTYKSEETEWDGEEKKETTTLYFNAGSGEIAAWRQIKEDGKTGELFMVFDAAKGAIASFITVDTVKMCMPMQIPFLDEEKKEAEPVEFKVTGKKRKIAGMQAEEWLASVEGEETRLWIATTDVGDLSTVFHAFGELQGESQLKSGQFGKGLIVAGSFKKAHEEKPSSTFEATEVKLNTLFTFSSEGYQRAM